MVKIISMGMRMATICVSSRLYDVLLGSLQELAVMNAKAAKRLAAKM